MNAAADSQGAPQTTPAPGRPGSLPFTPYGGTTAPYSPKAGTTKSSEAKKFTCPQCKASGFVTRAELNTHVGLVHPAGAAQPGNAPAP